MRDRSRSCLLGMACNVYLLMPSPNCNVGGGVSRVTRTCGSDDTVVAVTKTEDIEPVTSWTLVY